MNINESTIVPSRACSQKKYTSFRSLIRKQEKQKINALSFQLMVTEKEPDQTQVHKPLVEFDNREKERTPEIRTKT